MRAFLFRQHVHLDQPPRRRSQRVEVTAVVVATVIFAFLEDCDRRLLTEGLGAPLHKFGERAPDARGLRRLAAELQNLLGQHLDATFVRARACFELSRDGRSSADLLQRLAVRLDCRQLTAQKRIQLIDGLTIVRLHGCTFCVGGQPPRVPAGSAERDADSEFALGVPRDFCAKPESRSGHIGKFERTTAALRRVCSTQIEVFGAG